MIKTKAIKTWSDRVNFTLRNKFSWTFKVLKPMSFQGIRPLDPTRTLRRAPGYPTRAGLCGKPRGSVGYARTLFPI